MAFDVFKRVLGVYDNYEDGYEEDSFNDEENDVEEEPISSRRERYNSRRTSDFSFRDGSSYAEERRSNSPVQMVLVKGKKYSDVERIAENLKQRRSVIINFEGVEAQQAQRVIDYLCGTTFAMSGVVQKLSNRTFIFAVGQVDLVGRIEELKEQEGFNL
ncbi:MAG: cell division protein SepF [Bacillota bacterium]|nr:cell division protein SepF [Bacillota bacterium]